MKKAKIIVLLFCLISCTPIKKSHEIFISPSLVTIEPTATNSTLPKVTTTKPLASTATIELSVMATSFPNVMVTQRSVSTATFNPYIIPTPLQEITAIQSVFNLIQKEYIPSNWDVIYDKGMIWKIVLGSKEQIWILGRNDIGLFDGNNWHIFSEKDHGLSNASDMAVAPDGTIWIASPQAISHYKEGLWNIYSTYNLSSTGYPCLGIDSSNLVWLSLWDCICTKKFRTFDGINWEDQSLSQFGEIKQLLFTPDGSLWASNSGAIGQYNGRTWKTYSAWALWHEVSGSNIRIASDRQGNIYGIDYHQEWIVMINRDSNISNIPFDFINYKFIPEIMRIFIDDQGRIWTNACYNGIMQGCLAYYQDNQWISFKNLPFLFMVDMKELSDGSLLVATNNGLYQYKPAN